MLEFILVITLMTSDGKSVELETIDGFQTKQECERFYGEWKAQMRSDNHKLASSLIINGQCKDKRLINRKFG